MLLGISPALGRSEASRSDAEVERVAGTGICALSDVEAEVHRGPWSCSLGPHGLEI